MMYYYNDLYPLHMFGVGSIITLLFWAVIIYGAIMLFRGNSRNGSGEKGKAMEILKERYAKGEITKEQFESMKKDLE